MKITLTLILIQFSLMSMGQTLEQKIAQEACKCFNSSNSKIEKDNLMEEFMNTCFKESSFKFKDEIQKKFDIRDTTDYSAGYDWGKKFAPIILSSLIMNCDNFYYFFDSLRWSGINMIDRNKVEQDILINNERIKDGPKNQEAYFSRGFDYFQLGKLNKAKKDFIKTINIDNTFGPAYLYLGWTKEIKGNFIGAKLDYQKCLDLTGKPEITLLISIADRKERELNSRKR